MAISKNRPNHKAKVAERYKELVAMRLEAGMTRSGANAKGAKAQKRKPHQNPNRINMTKSQKRVSKAQRRSAKV